MLLWLHLPFLALGAIALTLLAVSLAHSRVPSVQFMTVAPALGAILFAAMMWSITLFGFHWS